MSARPHTRARQDRSRATERRIYDAAVRLIARHGYETLSVATIARAARVSIGGVYARYADKLALIHAVDEQLVAEFDAKLAQAMDPARLAGRDVAGVIEAYVRTMVAYFARHRDLLRQVVLRARTTNDPQFTTRVRQFNRRAHGAMCNQLLARQQQIAHPDPERAAAFGIMFVSAAARESVLFGDRRLDLTTVGGRELVRELVRAYCAYLGVTLPDDQP